MKIIKIKENNIELKELDDLRNDDYYYLIKWVLKIIPIIDKDFIEFQEDCGWNESWEQERRWHNSFYGQRVFTDGKNICGRKEYLIKLLDMANTDTALLYRAKEIILGLKDCLETNYRNIEINDDIIKEHLFELIEGTYERIFYRKLYRVFM